ncbi:MAG: hypothetical protein WC348_04430 [Patescibacteria group bacterium]|jgi:hypothetical protein
MAKSRRKAAGETTEFGDLSRIDEEKRATKRERVAEGHERKGKEKEKDWREDLEEMGGEDWVAEQRKEKARGLALYSNLRTKYDQGLLEREDLVIFLERFPSEAEYAAYQKLAEAIQGGGVEADIEDLKKDSETTARRRTIIQRIRKPEPGEGWVNKNKNVEVTGKVRFASLPKGEEGEAVEKEYRKILREYALGELTEKDVQVFFSDFSLEEKAAYEKILTEIKERETHKRKDRLSREDIEEMLMRGLGFREELIKDIPTKEGKTLFEEMLDNQIEIVKGVMLDSVSRADYEKKIEAAGGDRVKAEKELIAESAKKFLAVRELFTHGVVGYDREKGQIVLKHYSDLDGKCAIALFGKIGLDIKNVGYLLPGEIREGQTTVDSGNFAGVETNLAETVDRETGKRVRKISLVVDHHAWPADRETSATKNVYKVLTELGLLKFEDEKDRENYEKVVEWVTQTDNFSFPEMEKHFQDSDRKMIGFLKSRAVTLNTLLNFADSGKEVTDLLEEKDLRRFGLIYRKKGGEVVDHAADRREMIKKTLDTVRELIDKKWVVTTKDGKRFIVDTQNKIGGEGQWAAASLGYDGVIRYTPETHNFFVALNKGTFDKKTFAGLPQGKLVRGSVFIKLAGGEKLTVTLGDLVGRIAPNFDPEKDSEFEKFLETEPRRLRVIISQANNKWWWANTPNGEKIIIFDRDIPKDFKPGQEAYVRLAFPHPQEADEEQKREYNISKFYIGRFEPDKIILPKKLEEKKEEAKTEAKPVKQEVRQAPPPVEKPKTPEEERKRKAEGIIRQTVADKRREFFTELMGIFQRNPIYRNKRKEELEGEARKQIDIKIKPVERDLRKKYGL